MQIKIFGDNTYFKTKGEATNEVVKSFIAFYKANNLSKKDIVAFVPVTDRDEFGYMINLWVLLDR